MVKIKDIAVGYTLVYMHDIVDVPGNTRTEVVHVLEALGYLQ